MGISTAHPPGRGLADVARRTRRNWRFPILACALGVLAGCVAPARPNLKPDLPATWRNATAASAPAPDLRGWWKAFSDAELDRLVDQALADNLTIAQAALRLEGARALAGHRYSAFLPQLGAHTLSEPTPDSSASYFQFGFDARWELGLFGRSKSQARISMADLGVAEADAQAARVSVVAEVVRSYIELRGAQHRLQLLQQVGAGAQDKVDLTETRLRLRLASANELARARIELASSRAALAEPQLAIERNRQKLAVLLGRSEPLPEWSGTGAQPRLGDLGIESMPADLLRTRPEIQRAESEVLKALGEYGVARADRFPRIGLGGSLTYSSRVLGHGRLSDADAITTIGPAIDIPLFDWGARKAAADAHEKELSASVLAYRQTVLEGVAEAETAMAALAQQRERAAALAGGVASLEQAKAANGTLSRLGLADGFDRISANAELAQARLELAAAEQDRGIAFIALYKALGGAPLPAAVER